MTPAKQTTGPEPIDAPTDQPGKLLHAWRTPDGRLFFGTAGHDAARRHMGLRSVRHLRSRKPVEIQGDVT